MKSDSSLLPVAAALFAGLIAISDVNRANAQSLDPQTGMPVVKKRGSAHSDPASGLPGADATNEAQAERSAILEIGAIDAEAAAIRACIHNVVFQMSSGNYEKALQRCLTAQGLPKTESEAQLLFSEWAKLGQLYPPAKQALQKIRDEDTRQFSEAGGGSLVLFSEVACLNRHLQDEAATCALFKQIANQNPPLAGYYYPVAEDSLFSQGEYSLCLSFIGDPQKRFESYRGGFNGQRGVQQDVETWSKNNPPPVCYPSLPPLPDSRPAATNGFVEHVCKLMAYLVATGNRADAENIRTQAVAHVGSDPRFLAALNRAEEYVKKNGVVSLPTTGLPQYAGDHSRAELGLVLACATPTEAIRFMPPFMQVMVRIARGEYDQALHLIQAFCQQPNFPSVAVVLPDWMELARIYPPAMQTMIKVRDRDTREFEEATAGHNIDNVGLFLEARLLHDALGETNATYVMCQHLLQHNPAQFQASFYLMEPILMQHGDYQLCLKSIGDPQANLEMMRTNLEFMRKVLPLMRENETKTWQQLEKSLNKGRQFLDAQADDRQQFEQRLITQNQQFRQNLWAQLRTNTPDADEMPLSPPANYLPFQTSLSPRLVLSCWQMPAHIDSGLTVTNFFVNRVCVIVDVLVAAGHKADAEQIRDQAVAILDDPRLHSAVGDAEQKIKK